MFSHIFLKGFFFGFSIAAVIGPIGVLCIRRSIAQGFWAGIFTGLGAALADATYAAVAAFGLTVVTTFLLEKTFLLSILGGSYLLYLGYKAFVKCPKLSREKISGGNLISMLVETFFLTMTNPVTILAFIALFTAFNLSSANLFLNATLVFGFFLGSTLWWILLSSLGTILKQKLTSITTLTWINRISGIIISSFGIFVLAKSIYTALTI